MTETNDKYYAIVQVTAIYDYAAAQEFLKEHNAQLLKCWTGRSFEPEYLHRLDDGSWWRETDVTGQRYVLELVDNPYG